MIRVKRLKDNAILPKLGSELAAGLDLYITENAMIPPMMQAKLSTGIAMELPENCVGQIWARSKLANRYGLQIMGGVVDADYRGEIMISILNNGNQNVDLRDGDRVAQMIIVQHSSFYDVVEVDELSETDRGAKGINSLELRR